MKDVVEYSHTYFVKVLSSEGFIACVGGSRASEKMKDPFRKIECSENHPRKKRYLTSGTVKNPS